MNIKNEKSYEELVKRVEELEAKVKKTPTTEETYRETRKTLGSYDDRIKTEKEIILKNNAYIKNRKGIFDWAENVLAITFNNTNPQKLNQIQIGQDREEKTGERILDTNTVIITATPNKKALLEGESDSVKASNGAINIRREIEDEDYGGFISQERLVSLGDKEGVITALIGSEKNGLAGIGNLIRIDGVLYNAICFHTEQDTDGGIYQQHIKHFVDILPSSDGGIVPKLGRKGFHYSELVLRSPDGSSWAIRVDNSGNLTRTKL